MVRLALGLVLVSVAIPALAFEEGPAVYNRLKDVPSKSMPHNTHDKLQSSFGKMRSRSALMKTTTLTLGGKVTEITSVGSNYVTDTRLKSGFGVETREWGYRAGAVHFHAVVIRSDGPSQKVLTNTSGNFQVLTFDKERPGLRSPTSKKVTQAEAKALLHKSNASRGGRPLLKLFFAD